MTAGLTGTQKVAVVLMNMDHEGAAKAIAAGMKAGHSKEHPGYWLHTGGTGILTWEDTKENFPMPTPMSFKDFQDGGVMPKDP